MSRNLKRAVASGPGEIGGRRPRDRDPSQQARDLRRCRILANVSKEEIEPEVLEEPQLWKPPPCKKEKRSKKKLQDAQANAQKSSKELQQTDRYIADRETKLAALAPDGIHKQADKSSEVIHNLQEQLEKVKSQLQSVEREKDSLIKKITSSEGTSKQNTLTEVRKLMESELQCSICAEFFMEATALNCSHTFCKYCINMWKKNKNDCPICRSQIKSECRSLVLDSFIEKMVQNLTDEMKIKRRDILKYREECESELARNKSTRTRRRNDSYNEPYDSDSFYEYEDDDSDIEDFSDSDVEEWDYATYGRRWWWYHV